VGQGAEDGEGQGFFHGGSGFEGRGFFRNSASAGAERKSNAASPRVDQMARLAQGRSPWDGRPDTRYAGYAGCQKIGAGLRSTG
jgi:hypothetical protein